MNPYTVGVAKGIIIKLQLTGKFCLIFKSNVTNKTINVFKPNIRYFDDFKKKMKLWMSAF